MAAIILTNPASLSFANNPIVFRVKTDKSLNDEESFLRIVCNVTFTLNATGGIPYYDGSTTFVTEMSQPVENQGTAVFNLSDAAQTLIRNVQSSIDMDGGDALHSYNVYAEASFKDVWLLDGYEQSGGGDKAPRIYIVPGGLTDYEQLTMTDTYLLSLTKDGRAMTRKPDGGILYKGETLVVPTLYGYYDESNPEMSDSKTASASLKIGGKSVYQGSSFIESNELDYQTAVTSSATEDGEFLFESTMGRSLSGYYRTNTRGVHFLRFINGFGAVENISVRAKDKLTYEVSGETHSLVQEIGTRPTDRRYATKSQPVGVYELSSGYVPQRWAEWYVQELLTSPRVWILLGGKWVPALIEAEDDCVIYDRSKPEMPHVDFTLRLAIDGVTGVTW